jgi:hypothetical protein
MNAETSSRSTKHCGICLEDEKGVQQFLIDGEKYHTMPAGQGDYLDLQGMFVGRMAKVLNRI